AGVDRPLQSVDEARAVAADLGYPVIFKATAGGGGIGMSRVDRPADLASAFESAQSVALANFGNPDLFLEKYLLRTRHVEVQVLLDSRDGVGFVERECSVQRRHQKLVEETPSPAVGRTLRARLIDTAARASGLTAALRGVRSSRRTMTRSSQNSSSRAGTAGTPSNGSGGASTRTRFGESTRTFRSIAPSSRRERSSAGNCAPRWSRTCVSPLVSGAAVRG